MSGWKKMRKRTQAMLLVCAMLLSLCTTGFMVSAEEIPTGLCVHHIEHNEECGYREGQAGADCTHIHDESCGYMQATEGTPCSHAHNEACGYVEGQTEIPCDQNCTDTDDDGIVNHVEGCTYRPAVEGVPCAHVHDDGCGYMEATESAPCAHVHDAACGYAEADEGTACKYVAEGCAFCVVGWTWNGAEQLSQGTDGWTLTLYNVSQAEPLTRETLATQLPQSVAADLGTGAQIGLDLTWELSALPEEGAWTGTYTVTAALSQPYALAGEAAPLVVTLELDGAENYANRQAIPSGTPPYEELWVNGLSPKGTTINLFDYWLTTQTDADNSSLSWLINKGINANHALLFGVGIQSNNQNVGNWNLWTGSWAPRKGIVASTLEGGYPRLNVDMSLASDTNFNDRDDRESLAYLFDPNIQHNGKASYEDVQGLLQVDKDGYYYYNSHKNYAVYYEDTNSFTLYQRPGVRTGGASPNGQFFPFNAATTNTGNFMNNNVSTHPSINHYFGMHMTTRFIQQNGGHINESHTKPITYEFAGDDDVWLFVDGVLVADLGGIHNAASVKLDFSTGVITINGQTQPQRLGTLLGYTTDTLPDNTYHTLDFFYLERGNVDSNMNLRYNLLTIPESNLIKVDQMGDAVAGAVFELYDADEYKQNPNTAIPIATGTTDENGQFVFLTNDKSPITIQSLYDMYGDGKINGETALILAESEPPPGYRSNGDIELYFYKTKEDEVLLLSNSTWDKGAYAMAKAATAAPNQIKLKESANSASPPDNGIIDLTSKENPLMFAVVYQKQEHKDASGADVWLPVSGDPLRGWTVEQDSSWQSILHAAQENPYVFQMSGNGTYQVEVTNLPGSIESYYHICKNADDARYMKAPWRATTWSP